MHISRIRFNFVPERRDAGASKASGGTKTNLNIFAMKTQICDLINGSKNVIRDLSASKYAGCPAGTSAEFAGTTIRKRAEVAEAVKLENPETLHINVRGVELVLQAARAKTSGRIVNYCADITFTQWCTITGRGTEVLEIYKFETSFCFRVNADMTAEALIFARKSPAAMWRTRKYEYIDESFITIL